MRPWEPGAAALAVPSPARLKVALQAKARGQPAVPQQPCQGTSRHSRATLIYFFQARFHLGEWSGYGSLCLAPLTRALLG